MPTKTGAAGKETGSKKSGAAGKKTGRGSRNKDLGLRGEEAAARFLYRMGYDIMERNWRCNFGEADIIAQDGQTLVFVEVKTRSNLDKGFPAEAVGAVKREKYEKIALAFLSNHDICDVAVRFDVVSVVAVAKDRALIKHHISAFSVA